MTESLWQYARREGLREGLRVATLTVLQPFVMPIFRFAWRHYHTEASLRLAKIAGDIMWWQLHDDPKPLTARELLDDLYDHADRSKAFEWPSPTKERTVGTRG